MSSKKRRLKRNSTEIREHDNRTHCLPLSLPSVRHRHSVSVDRR
jgi:hypothetical protein